MGSFLMRRLVASLGSLFAASVLVFVLVANAGDPLADLRDQPDIAPEVIEARRHALHLDEPVLERYARWLTNFLNGEFGTSLTGRSVRTLLWERLQVTLRMVTAAGLIALGVALILGVIAAVRQHSAFDQGMRFVTYLFLALPVFWLGGLLKEFAAIRLNRLFGRQIIYTIGAADPNLAGPLAERLANYAGHLVLPTVTLMLAPIAIWTRYLRSSMLDVLGTDYIRTARAKGLGEERVVLRHGLRNALVPLTTLVGLHFGHLFAGAVVVERVFSWQGMGQMLLDGVNAGDTNVVLAWLMVTATAVLVFNLLTDLAYGWLDPRVRP